MKKFFANEGFFEWLWRASLLVLPWQTRWFHEAFLDGYVWEQGRISVYASMMLLVAVVILGKTWKKRSWQKLLLFCFVGAIFLIGSFNVGVSLQWTLWVLLLIAWVWTLVERTNEDDRERWILYALLLPAICGLAQVLFQYVPAASWLGIAAQNPLTRGVSVIEAGGRWLRAYGSFPHPNIFGGWMMLGVFLGMRRYVRGEGEKWVFACTVLYGAMLYLSFSRSAWIGCVVGLGLFLVLNMRLWQRITRLGIAVMGSVALLVAWHPELLLTRLETATRLEQWSVNERRASLDQGGKMVNTFFFSPSGVANARLRLQYFCKETSCLAPREPPHNVPLLALIELGWIRFILLCGGLFWVLWNYRASFRAWLPLFVSFGGIAMLDHYLWSLWAGMTLVAVGVLTVSTDSANLATHHRSEESKVPVNTGMK